MFELIVGHDRMLGDVRPQAYAKLGYSSATPCCHPYDICTELIAREAGCVIERPEGGALRVPLDTTTPVAGRATRIRGWPGRCGRSCGEFWRRVCKIRRVRRLGRTRRRSIRGNTEIKSAGDSEHGAERHMDAEAELSGGDFGGFGAPAGAGSGGVFLRAEKALLAPQKIAVAAAARAAPLATPSQPRSQ